MPKTNKPPPLSSYSIKTLSPKMKTKGKAPVFPLTKKNLHAPSPNTKSSTPKNPLSPSNLSHAPTLKSSDSYSTKTNSPSKISLSKKNSHNLSTSSQPNHVHHNPPIPNAKNPATPKVAKSPSSVSEMKVSIHAKKAMSEWKVCSITQAKTRNRSLNRLLTKYKRSSNSTNSILKTGKSGTLATKAIAFLMKLS